MKSYQNYALGEWVSGEGVETELFNAITGDQIGTCSSVGLNYEEMMHYAKEKGGKALRKMTFQQRGLMLKELALFLLKNKRKYYELSAATGATRVDSWIDIEGGIGNLFANASLRRQFPDLPYYVDGDPVPLSKGGSFMGHHIMVPKEGVAIHINAFNFPIWGMLEKIAVNFMAGVPAIVKPSEYTCYLTELMVRDIVASGILPEGALQLVVGLGRGVIDFAGSSDVVTFTGSAATGNILSTLPNIQKESVAFNLECDSLNAAILGQDAVPGSPEFDIFIKEVQREITVKAGQKCTAVRRIIVPEDLMDDVQGALAARLAKTVIGDPSDRSVRMGALITKLQVERVRANVELLKEEQDIVIGDLDNFDVVGADKEAGAFFSPIVFRNEDPHNKLGVHNIECFGPVSTLMPYKDIEDAVEIAKLGKGSLVSTIVTANDSIATDYVLNAASMHGRILVLNERCAKESTGHGSPMPMLTHGGPGRAGGGEEMGGKRGVLHYMQRTVCSGTAANYFNRNNRNNSKLGAKYNQKQKYASVFRKHFEELK